MRKPPWGECQRCGFNYRLTKIKREWTGLRVCKGTGTNNCWDTKPADQKPPRFRPEGLPLSNAAPETEPVFGRASKDDL